MYIKCTILCIYNVCLMYIIFTLLVNLNVRLMYMECTLHVHCLFLFLFVCFSFYRHSFIGKSTSRLLPSRPAHTTIRYLFRYLFRSLFGPTTLSLEPHHQMYVIWQNPWILIHCWMQFLLEFCQLQLKFHRTLYGIFGICQITYVPFVFPPTTLSCFRRYLCGWV